MHLNEKLTPAGKELTLKAADGYQLAATLFQASTPVKGTILVAGATGVQQKLYRRFAGFAASQGYTTLTFDYRGIGRSAPQDLRNFPANYLEWGYMDAAAAVDYLTRNTEQIYLVGHSFGGYVPGLLPKPEKLKAAYCFGTGAAWTGWMSRSEGLKVSLLWKVVLPLIVKLKGYMAWSLLNMGDDLPTGIYQAWKHWSSFPHFFFDDPNMAHLKEQYARVNIPLMFATATDDPWAPPKSRDALTLGYPNTLLETLDISPHTKKHSIGHMGYFLNDQEKIWQDALTWLHSKEQSSRQNITETSCRTFSC